MNTFKKALGGSRGRRGCSIHVTSRTHKGLTHPAKTPALKVCRGLHTTASWQCWGCISAAGKSLFTPQGAHHPQCFHPCPCCPGTPPTAQAALACPQVR